MNKSWTEIGCVLQKVAVAPLQGRNGTFFVNIEMTAVNNYTAVYHDVGEKPQLERYN